MTCTCALQKSLHQRVSQSKLTVNSFQKASTLVTTLTMATISKQWVTQKTGDIPLVQRDVIANEK